jgi:hypothetical protein
MRKGVIILSLLVVLGGITILGVTALYSIAMEKINQLKEKWDEFLKLFWFLKYLSYQYWTIPETYTKYDPSKPIADLLQSAVEASEKLKNTQNQVQLYAEEIGAVINIGSEMQEYDMSDWNHIVEEAKPVARKYLEISTNLVRGSNHMDIVTAKFNLFKRNPDESMDDYVKRLEEDVIPRIHQSLNTFRMTNLNTNLHIDMAHDMATDLCAIIKNTSLKHEEIIKASRKGNTLMDLAKIYGTSIVACFLPGKILGAVVGSAVAIAGGPIIAAAAPAIAIGILGVSTGSGYVMYDRFVVQEKIRSNSLFLLNHTNNAAKMIGLQKVFLGSLGEKIDGINIYIDEFKRDLDQRKAFKSQVPGRIDRFIGDLTNSFKDITFKYQSIIDEKVNPLMIATKPNAQITSPT